MASTTDDAAVDPFQHLLDVLLYAPIGLVAKGSESFPDLVERGRSRAANARVIGQFALNSTNAKARRSLTDAEQHISAFLRIVADAASPSKGSSASTPSDAGPVPSEPSNDSTIEGVIAGYDDLTAAQILPLLSGLDPEQLAVVESHERSTRARKTVLSRLRQLQR